MDDKVWNKNQIIILKKMWSEGKSATEISKKIDRSRAAILGKARRLNLKPRDAGSRKTIRNTRKPTIA